jgi:hypothetical protein
MTTDRARLAGQLDGLAEWVDVRAADRVPDGWVSCAELLRAQQAGEDPTRWWRDTVAEQYGVQYGIEPPAQVAAMLVLLWYVSVPAQVAAAASALTGGSSDVSPAGLAFHRHPTQHYPDGIALLPGPELSVAEAAAVARAHTRAFVDSYAPGVKIGSRQRYGAITDEFTGALRLCADAPHLSAAKAAFAVDPDEPLRESCCFIYALPGLTPCAGCPRLA